MPLLISSKPFTSAVTDITEFLTSNPHFKATADELKSISQCEIPPNGLLYVNQREYAVITPDDNEIKVLGSEDATTCHLMVIRHTGTGVTGLSHLDGCDTQRGLSDMVSQITSLSQGGPDGRLEVTLVGGFIDNKKESEKVSKESIGILQKLPEELHLVCACITDYNNVLKRNLNFPAIYGIAVDVQSGHIYPATFPDKGPEMDVRSACLFGGFAQMMNIYNNSEHQLVIGPFTWEPWEQASHWISLPDAIIRKYLSTSPEQEPPYFETNVRKSLKVLSDHPNPEESLFPEGKPLRYRHQNGCWTLVEND